MELEPIQHIWLNHDTDLVDLTLTATVKGANGKATPKQEVLHTNEKHPFLTREKGFLPVSQLKAGMHVREANGSYGVVARLVVVPGAMWMYNLTVAQDHTYTVGTAHWIVHNCTFNYDGKIAGQMGQRGWTDADIQNAIDDPAATYNSTDVRNPGDGSAPSNDPATVYYSKNGGYVVINDNTGNVVQVSSRNDPGWLTPWGVTGPYPPGYTPPGS